MCPLALVLYSCLMADGTDASHRSGRSMEEAVREAVAGGATIVPIREKDADGGSFLAPARAAHKETDKMVVYTLWFSHIHTVIFTLHSD